MVHLKVWPGAKVGVGFDTGFTPTKFGIGYIFNIDTPTAGLIDEVAIFNYDALLTASAIYNQGQFRDLTTLFQPPIHWYKFTQTDIDNHPTLEDHIGSLDLTATGFATGNIVSI